MPKSRASGLRTWTSATGETTVEAALIAVRDAVVFLERRDGTVIKVPLESLCAADRRILGDQIPADPQDTSDAWPRVDIPGEDLVRPVGKSRTIASKEFQSRALAFSPDGLRLAAVDVDWVKVYDVVDGAEVATRRLEANDGDRRQLAFSPTGDRLFVATKGAVFSFQLDAAGLSPLGRFSGHQGEIQCLAVSSDGRRAVSGDDLGRMFVWETDTDTELAARTSVGAFAACAFRDFHTVLAIEQGELVEWNWRGDRMLRRPLGETRSAAPGADFSADGNIAVLDGGGSKVHLWDARRHALLDPILTASFDRAPPRFTVDGRRALLFADGHLEVWSVRPARRIHRAAAPGEAPRTLATSPDNIHVAVGRKDAIDILRVAPAE